MTGSRSLLLFDVQIRFFCVISCFSFFDVDGPVDVFQFSKSFPFRVTAVDSRS